jgi:O-methyltransferase
MARHAVSSLNHTPSTASVPCESWPSRRDRRLRTESKYMAGVRTLRDWVAVVFPRRIALFDRLNANAEFVKLRRSVTALADAPDRRILHRTVSEHLGQIPIDYLEFGVWRAESLQLWAQLNQNPDTKFFGFDTFEGLPEAWGEIPKGTFSLEGQVPELSDPRIRLIRGLFQKTLYPFLASYQRAGRVVLHVDCDLYTSTLFCLALMDRFLRRGDIIIFDDFYSLDHEFDAFLDYSRTFYRRLKPLAASTHCAQIAFSIENDLDGGIIDSGER